MGMYTELFVEGMLRADAPQAVKDVMTCLFDRNAADGDPTLPDHPFFQCARWRAIGSCSSFYHVPVSMTAMATQFDGRMAFVSRADLKNYDGEIELFLQWLQPYCETLRGWSWYEEEAAPTLFDYYP